MNTAARTYSYWNFRNWSISVKLVIISLFLTLIPLLVGTLVMAQRSAKALSDQMEANLTSLNTNIARTLQGQFFDYQFETLQQIADNTNVKAALVPQPDQDQESIDESITQSLIQAFGDSNLDAIAVLDTSGMVLYASGNEEVGLSYAESEYFKAALAGKPYISQLYFLPRGTEPSADFAIPIRETEDEISKIIGVAWLRVGTFQIDFLLQDILGTQSVSVNDSQKASISIYTVNEQGLVANADYKSPARYRLITIDEAVIKQYSQEGALGSTCPPNYPIDDMCEDNELTTRTLHAAPALQPLLDQLRSAWNSSEVQTIRYCEPRQLDAAPVTNPQSCDGKWKVMSYQTIKPTQTGQPMFSLVVEMDEDTILASAREQRQQGLIIAALIAPLAVVASFFIGRTMARPINRLASVVHEVEGDEEHFHPEEISDLMQQGDEIGNLARMLSSMILALDARMEELRTIYEIGQTISSSVELQETLQYMLTSIQTVIRYDWAEICMYDPNSQQMSVEVAADHDSIEQVDVKPYDATKGYIGQLIKDQRGLLVPNMNDLAPPTVENERSWQHINPQAYLGVPLKFKDKVIGTIELVNRNPGAFNEDNLRILESIAAQAAIAVQNAQQVIARESKLKQEIMELKIEIDQTKKTRDVSAITESQYFQDLQSKVQGMRKRKTKQEGSEE